MGLFDYIHFRGLEFQTKDFDDELRDYYIEYGRLLKGSERKEGEKAQPLNGSRDACSCDFSGEIFFYGDIIGEWFDYRAVFSAGNLVSVDRRDG